MKLYPHQQAIVDKLRNGSAGTAIVSGGNRAGIASLMKEASAPEPRLGRRSFLGAAIAAVVTHYATAPSSADAAATTAGFAETLADQTWTPSAPVDGAAYYDVSKGALLLSGELGALCGFQFIASGKSSTWGPITVETRKPNNTVKVIDYRGMPVVVHSEWCAGDLI